MKKVFSLILAVAMVLSLASVAFAAFETWTPKDNSSTSVTHGVKKYDNTVAYNYDGDTHSFAEFKGNPTFGKTIYYPLLTEEGYIVTEDKAVSSLKLDYTIENAAAYVKSVSIVKKYGSVSATGKFFYLGDKKSPTNVPTADNKKDAYYIAVETQGSSTAKQYVSGIITLTGKSGPSSNKLKDEAVHFDFTLAWEDVATKINGFEVVLKDEKDSATKLITVGSAGKNETEITTNRYGEKVKYTVDMVASEKVVVKFSDAEVDAIVDANEEAGISFYNFNGATFKRSGDLFFEQDLEDEDAYLYEIMADGSLKNLSSCYDEDEGGFLLKVKKLGFYCVSDLPLVDAEGTVAAVAGAVNPTTGAIA